MSSERPISMRPILHRARVIPVITFDQVEHALPIGGALVSAGLCVLEVTLRTSAGLSAIERLRNGLGEDAVVGAGTVLSGADATSAIAAGATFLVSPGFVPSVHEVCVSQGVAYLPAIATVTEALSAIAAGYDAVKVFPANSVGGPAFLAALGSVFPDLLLCPTGGVGARNLADYARLSNVACVGGSWVVPSVAALAENDEQACQLAREAVKIVKSVA